MLNLAELVVLMHDEWYYIVEALDPCRESCQAGSAHWVRPTVKRRVATQRRCEARFGHMFLHDEFHSSLLVRTDQARRVLT